MVAIEPPSSQGTKWWLRFSDGHEECVTFEELLVFAYNWIAFQRERERQAEAQGANPSKDFVFRFDNFQFVVDGIFNDDYATVLLSKMRIEDVGHDA